MRSRGVLQELREGLFGWQRGRHPLGLPRAELGLPGASRRQTGAVSGLPVTQGVSNRTTTKLPVITEL